jgi:hypothetical protein
MFVYYIISTLIYEYNITKIDKVILLSLHAKDILI